MPRGVLLDIAGVLYDGGAPFPGAAAAVGRLRTANLPVRFLTNSTRRPKRLIVQRLRDLGFPVAMDDVLTPAAASCAWLETNGFAPHLLVHPDLEEDFADCRRKGPPAVVVGDAGRYFTYERLNAAFRLIDRGAPFLALAANRAFRDDDGARSMDAGGFVRALEFASGKNPLLFGKPAAGFFQAGAASLGCALRDVVMVGDDTESDVAGAIAAGLGQGILVRTGKYRDGDEALLDPARSLTVDDIGAAVDRILRDTPRGG